MPLVAAKMEQHSTVLSILIAAVASLFSPDVIKALLTAAAGGAVGWSVHQVLNYYKPRITNFLKKIKNKFLNR
jgi:hypothetical protein